MNAERNVMPAVPGVKASRFTRLRHLSIRDRWLFLMILFPVAHVLVFSYLPMYGVLIVFQDYNAFSGFFRSEWVGFKNFQQVVLDPYFWKVAFNTLRLGVISFLFGFPAPIVLAMLLNELKSEKYKKVVQSLTYLPHFISMIVICGIIVTMLSPSTGLINLIVKAITSQSIYFMTEPNWFIPIFVISNIWVGTGFGAIIYLAALSGIDPVLYESSVIDGASRWQKAIYITIPGIMPTIVILLILGMPSLISVNFEKVLLLYHPLTYSVADVIPTYVYRKGLLGGEFSYATTVGFFMSVISLMLIVIANAVSKKLSENSLW